MDNNIKLWNELPKSNEINKCLFFDDLGYKYELENCSNIENKIFVIFYDKENNYYYYIKTRPRLFDIIDEYGNKERNVYTKEIGEYETILYGKELTTVNSLYIECSQIFKIKKQDLEYCINNKNFDDKNIVYLSDDNVEIIKEIIKDFLFIKQPYFSILEVFVNNHHTQAKSLYLCDLKIKQFLEEIEYDDMDYEENIHLYYSSNNQLDEYQYNRFKEVINFGKLFLNEYFDESIVKDFLDKHNVK